MPDWTYQTVFKPVLMRLPYATARRLALGFMGGLARLPGGVKVIGFFGHMEPAACLATSWDGLQFKTRVGLGNGFDPELLASEALATFGIGFFDIGPVSADEGDNAGRVVGVDPDREVIQWSDDGEALSRTCVAIWLQQGRHANLPVILRIPCDVWTEDWPWAFSHPAGPHQLILAWPICDLLTMRPEERRQVTVALSRKCESVGCRMLWTIPATLTAPEAQQVAELLVGDACGDLLIDSSLNHDGCRTIGAPAFEALRSATAYWRRHVGRQAWIVASGGIHAPWQAILLEEGANLIEIDSGLVFTGPGLPKRLNEAIERQVAVASSDRRGAEAPPNPPPQRRLARQAWFWTMLMGASMIGGGLLALCIAATRVVMPYDEAHAGLSRQEINAVNDRLLEFMRHDRTTLAGTMLAVGILYCALSWYGGRRGIHWAHASIVWSAFAGFFSFFSFLGFGYFDPLHAFVTAILFQFLLLALYAELPPRSDSSPAELQNDWRWKLANWGQLVFIAHGLALLTAGVVISCIGMTSVFVATDLEFMQTTADALRSAHPRLVPLVAHDRATFGGMLIACGLTVFLSALWGFRRGHAWHWWALFISGNVAYFCALIVHMHVGYHDLMHLLPIYGGLTALWLGGALAYPFLSNRSTTTTAAVP